LIDLLEFKYRVDISENSYWFAMHRIDGTQTDTGNSAINDLDLSQYSERLYLPFVWCQIFERI
jgi:hypothetical protein